VKRAALLAAIAIGFGPALSCSSMNAGTQDPWAPDFDPPRALDTDRMHLGPLGAQHAELDHAALMSSVDHLRGTLGWNGWPRDGFTVEENRSDLVFHEREFEQRRSYAFTVQSPDRTRCVGCVYLNRLQDEDWKGAMPRDPRGVLLELWVVESELDTELDTHLFGSVLDWLDRDWPFATVYVPLRVENTRGTAIARERGLAEAPEVKIRDTETWRAR
jgi:hypothetical protein